MKLRCLKEKRILLISRLKDKKKPYLKKPLLAINDGCIKYQDKDFLNSDLLIVKKYLKNNDIKKDFDYVQKIYNFFLVKISSQLNKTHKVNYPIEYWRVIIGLWLCRFIFIIYERLKSANYLKKNYKILFVKVANEKKKLYECIDTYEFENKIANHQDEWNNLIYEDIFKILEYFPIKKFNYSENIKKNFPISQICKDFLLNIIFNISSYLSKKKYFFIGTYLSFKELILLQFKLGQLPFFARENIRPKLKLNNNLRLWNTVNLKKKSLKSILDILIPKYIPKIYLEGYESAIKFVEKLNWPKKPKFICSSISFYHDDIFKIYLAEQKLKNKTKFISMQHGGLYFTSKFFPFQIYQSEISDFFLTWGYKKKFSPKFVPIFNFANRYKKIYYKKKGKLLFINYEFPRFPYSVGSGLLTDSRNLKLLEDSFIFFKNLKYEVSNSTLIKLYPHDFGWDLTKRFNDNGIFCKFSNRNDNFFKLLNNSRLCVTNIDSTTYLQSLNLNFPTVIFFNKKVSFFTDDFLRDLKVLKKAKVFFDTPEQAAKQINFIWDSIENWWHSKLVQNAVNFFCEKYSKKSKNRVEDVYNYFKTYI
jgi:putative transferase (TIGR04331 family)